MSVKLTNISHGASNWEKDLNNNFAQLHQDTGWQKPTFYAPATGDFSYRVLNNYIMFTGTVIPNATGMVIVANIASDLVGTRNMVLIDAAGNLSSGKLDANGDVSIYNVQTAGKQLSLDMGTVIATAQI